MSLKTSVAGNLSFLDLPGARRRRPGRHSPHTLVPKLATKPRVRREARQLSCYVTMHREEVT